MKHNRLISLVLALALVSALVIMPASAATYTDTAGHWAESYINDVTAKGLFTGYEDNTFRPYNNLTAVEAIALCARMAGVSSLRAIQIEAEWGETVSGLLGTSYSWAHDELAICLETGILTVGELQVLQRNAALGKELAKEDLSMYLVRAMGLTELAVSLTDYDMDFKDLTTISAARRPYVYILNLYDIVEGDTHGNFSPKLAVNRAVVATMLSRVAAFMTDAKISIELPEYTQYNWMAGTITKVATAADGSTVVTLKSDVSGVKTLTVPANSPVYRYNMKTGASALQAGLFARAALSANGAAASVRLFGSLQTVSGTVSSISQDAVTVVSGGISTTYNITRLTEVKAGAQTGDRTVIAAGGGYSKATCVLSASGELLSLTLAGGTYDTEGILASVTSAVGGSVYEIVDWDGSAKQYKLATDAKTSIDGTSGTISRTHVGRMVYLTVSNDSDRIETADVDTLTQYVQGGIRSITRSRPPYKIGMTNLHTNLTKTYTLANNCAIAFEGKTAGINDVKTTWFATCELNTAGEIVSITAYPGTVVSTGVLTSLEYGSTVTMKVTDTAGDVFTFTFDLNDLPIFERNGLTSSFMYLKVGDAVSITTENGKVTIVESQAQEATLVGTITRIVQEAAGSTIDLKLEDGTTASYTIGSGISVTSGGNAVSASTLKVGYKLSLIVSGDELLSIEITEIPAAETEISGTVLFVDSTAKTILVQTDSDSLVTVSYSNLTRFMATSGSNISLSALVDGAGTVSIIAYGSYDGLNFNASLILKR